MMKLNFKLMYLLGLAITFSFVSCNDDDDTSDQNLVLASNSDVEGVWNLQNYSVLGGVKSVGEIISESTSEGTDAEISSSFNYSVNLLVSEESDFSLTLNSDGELIEQGSFTADLDTEDLETEGTFDVGIATTVNTNGVIVPINNGSIEGLGELADVNDRLFSSVILSELEEEESLFVLENTNSVNWTLLGANQLMFTISTGEEPITVVADILFVDEDNLRISMPMANNKPVYAENTLSSDILTFNSEPDEVVFVSNGAQERQTIVFDENEGMEDAEEEIRINFINPVAYEEGDGVFVVLDADGMPMRNGDGELIIEDVITDEGVMLPLEDLVLLNENELIDESSMSIGIVPAESSNHTNIAEGNNVRPNEGTIILTFQRGEN